VKFNNRNIVISESAKIGANVKIGDNTVIYDNVVIGDNTTICNDCVIGEPLNEYYSDSEYQNPTTRIGKNSLIRSHSIIYAGNTIGNHLVTGHHVIVRAGNQIGNYTSIGNFTEIHGNAIIRDYARLHSNVCICEFAVVDTFVWIFPGAILSNSSKPPSNQMIAPHIGSFSVVAVNSVILPGIKIGIHCLIGASAVVTKDIHDYSVAIGSPAKIMGDIREIKSKETEDEHHYPWPYHFSRGMPWEKIGFEQWKNENGFEND
jgi:acetyltransferase-like isoleucine patch superfamily enzyme